MREARERCDACRESAHVVEHADAAAQDEDEQDDVDGVIDATNGRKQELQRTLRVLCHTLVGARHGDGLGDGAVEVALDLTGNAQLVEGSLRGFLGIDAAIGVGDGQDAGILVIEELGILACRHDVGEGRGEQHHDEQHRDSRGEVELALLRLAGL